MNEIGPNISKELISHEIEPSSEVFNRSPRVVIYGQTIEGNFSGSVELKALLSDYLKQNDLSDESVTQMRSVEGIEDYFWNEHIDIETKNKTNPEKNTLEVFKRKSKLRTLLGAVSLRKNVEGISSVVIPVDNAKTSNVSEKTIPTAVFVFPYMREHGPYGNGTIETPIDIIEELCLDNGVTMVDMSHIERQQLVDVVKGLPVPPIEKN